MIVKINRVEFIQKLQIVQKSIEENKVKPIVSCAFVEAKNNLLTFCGTNLETTILTYLDGVEIIKSGKIVFQYQIVEEYLKQLRDEVIELHEEDGTLRIDAGDSSTEFNLMDSDLYPRVLTFEKTDDLKPKFSLKTKELCEIFEKVKYACSVLATNPALSCVRIESDEQFIKFVGTDGYRLVYLTRDNEMGEIVNISIPISAIEITTRLLHTIDDTDISLYMTNNQVFFKTDDILVSSRTIELAYPEYQGILTNITYDKKLTINAGDILKFLKRASIFVKNNTDSKYGAIFEFEQNKMKINGVSDIAQINEVVETEYSGEPLRISLNVKFMMEFIQNIPKDSNLTMELIKSNASVMIKEQDKEDYIYILMPLALR